VYKIRAGQTESNNSIATDTRRGFVAELRLRLAAALPQSLSLSSLSVCVTALFELRSDATTVCYHTPNKQHTLHVQHVHTTSLGE